MKVLYKNNDFKKLRQTLAGSLGFAPTMGYLHAGHVSLIELARKQNDHVIVSIFVNPKQFGANEDYQNYPRDLKHDLNLLKKQKVDIVYVPTVAEMYPPGYSTYVEVTDITSRLEGKSRSNHFTGVATVVLKLLNMTQPTRVYFGQKDAQQVAVVKKMVRDLHLSVEVIPCATIRESDGLALSSRNVFLTAKQRQQAPILFQSLSLVKKLFNQGEKKSSTIKSAMKQLVLTTQGKIDYISIADPNTLQEVEILKKGTLISLAVYFGKIRLIDNIIL